MAPLETLLETIRQEDIQTDAFAAAATDLALQSRKSPEIRTTLASPEILQIFLSVLNTHDTEAATEPALRCIGNACISNLDACSFVTESDFSWAQFLFSKRQRATEDLMVKVLYNICSQSEEAQKQCYRDNIHEFLIRSIDTDYYYLLDDDELSRALDLLLWIIAHHAEVAPQTTLPDDILKVLVDLPLQYSTILGAEDFVSLTEAVLVVLRDPETRKRIIKLALAAKLWELLDHNERKVHNDELIDDEERKLLTPLSTSLIWILSDLAAEPGFAKKYDLRSPLLKDLVDFLSDEHNEHRYAPLSTLTKSNNLRTAACQVIGNVVHALPAENAVPLIKSKSMHRRLFATMLYSDSPDYLHAAARLLVLLTRPSVEVRRCIANASDAFAAVKTLGRHSMPQLKQDALALMRALGRDVPEVQQEYKTLATEVMGAVAEAQNAQQNVGGASEMPNGGSRTMISG